MIRESSCTDKRALELVSQSVQDLTLYFMLAGLSLLGGAIEIVEKPVGTLCTDGRKIYYDPKWMHTLADRGAIYMMFDVLHEWFHVFFNHVARCGDKDKSVWNIACDMVVVHSCVQTLSEALGEVISAPDDGVQVPAWAEDMSAEDIYDRLISNKNELEDALPKKGNPSPQGGGDSGGAKDRSGEAPPEGVPTQGTWSGDFDYDSAAAYTASEEEDFREEFTADIHQAHMVMQQSGDTPSSFVGGILGSRMQELIRGKLPVARLLRGDALSMVEVNQVSYAHPNRRYYPQIILPTTYGYKEHLLLIAIDVSASVGDNLLREFIANVVPAAMRAESSVIVSFDIAVREEIHTRRPRSVLKAVKFLQGAHGRTSTLEVFEVADRVKPSAILILTDGMVDIPDKAYRNTLWVIPENGKELPWGRNYKIGVSW